MTYKRDSTRAHRALRGFEIAAAASVLVTLLCFGTTARAYDLSRQSSSSFDDEEKVERGFVSVAGGIWFPGPDTFNDNHQTSLQFAGEFGVRILSAKDQHLFIVGGVTFSPQTLEPHLIERDVDVIMAFVGVRYIPGTLCSARGIGCLFIEVGLGVTWETVDAELGHDPPKGDITFTAGLGYRFRLGRFLNLGVRVDLAYLEEDYESQIGWITPTGFIGASF
jgi:hypothetical protein